MRALTLGIVGLVIITMGAGAARADCNVITGVCADGAIATWFDDPSDTWSYFCEGTHSTLLTYTIQGSLQCLVGGEIHDECSDTFVCYTGYDSEGWTTPFSCARVSVWSESGPFGHGENVGVGACGAATGEHEMPECEQDQEMVWDMCRVA